ncbi:primosomal protein N' [Deinococcus sp.]|uniref:replication restart helicase PriA n=1 Tax=Deinococcus sp. TaxID=47478 RepID=UPI0025C6CB6C|nr:primosomal protein N' [Deinococcus sp.]
MSADAAAPSPPPETLLGSWQVVVPLPVPAVDFLPPHGWQSGCQSGWQKDWQGAAPLGCRVLVPWRGELVVALVVGASDGHGAHRLREAVHLLDAPGCPWVPPATVQGVSAWAADARIPAGLVWSDLLGVGWNADYVHRVRAVEGADLAPFARQVPGHDWTDAGAFAPALLDRIREQGLLDEEFLPVPRVVSMIRARELAQVPPAARSETVIVPRPWANVDEALRMHKAVSALSPHGAALTVRQAQAHAWLLEQGPQLSVAAWARGAGVTSAAAQKVLEYGAATQTTQERPPSWAWRWLEQAGTVKNLSQWASAAGVSNAEVTRLLNAGGAEYGFAELPPPAAWNWLREHGPVATVTAWARATDLSPAAAGALLARGWADSVQLPAPAPALPAPVPGSPAAPTDTLPEGPVWRLHGGRAAERFRALAPRLLRLLEQGRGVLVLAPDYATLRRAWDGLSGLAARAGTQAVQLTGSLSDVQREESWRLVRTGAARLVIGSSHALLAPLADPALVVVLEEGSDAHKLLSGSRAFLPDVAARIAAAHGAALAYVGSVPAAESVPVPGVVLAPPRARIHVVDYASPPEQPELGPLSSVHLTPGDLGYPLSHDLARLLRQVQERGRQAALLAPRRGYSALLRCPNCEHTPHCKNCDVPLRFHQETRQLTCHQCGYHEAIPDRCDHCGERMWKARGPGTEWIAQEVRRLLPGFPVLRLDKDHQDDLAAWQAGGPGVVVATQLLLSQEAPPNLALIGVTLADTWLSVSDFRASERYHRLLRQLAEWHPRRAPLLLVQTFQASHPALRVLVAGQDALAYPLAEERARKELGYPPHARLAQIEITAREAHKAQLAAHELAAALHGAGATETEVLGPAPSPVARLRGVYPYHIFLRARSDQRLGELLRILDSRTWKARVRVDVNPRGGL